MSTATDTLRTRNMQKRRTRIITEARKLLACGGNGALNLRDLASQANLTVPTIYNLIGKKEDVLLAVVGEVLNEIESRIAPASAADPLDLAVALVEESTRLFSEDEDFYRSAFLAVEGLEESDQHHHEVERIYAWAEALILEGVNACRKARLLRGRIPVESMSKLITRNYRMSCRGWAFGHYSIDEFRRQAIADLYIILAADAVEIFHSKLISNISETEAENNVATVTEKLKRNNQGEAI